MSALIASISSVWLTGASFFEGMARVVDLFGVLGPRVRFEVDPGDADRSAIRSDWERTRQDLSHGFESVDR